MATKTNSTKKNTRGSTLKSPVKSTGKPSQPKKGVTQSKNTIKKNRKPQRRELWVVGTFLAAFLLFLSVFGVEGMLLELLKSFIRGLIGSGSYILPFAFIIACVIIIFARGNPVAKKLTALFSVPVLFGMLDHFIMRDVEISEKYVQKLYMTGTVLESGGVISGGIAMLMSALLSEIGAMIITILVLVYTFLVIFNIKLSQIIDFIISIKDGYDERRIERGEYEYIEYDEYEEDEEPVYMSHWTKKPVPVPAQPKNENKYRPVTDIPLDPVSPVRKDKIKKQEEAEEGDFHEAAPKAKKKAPFNRNTETSYDGLVHIPRKKESYDGLVNNPRDNVPLPRFVPPSSDEEIEMWREQEEEKDALLFNVDVETEENTVSIPEENITVGPAKPVAENVVVVDTHKANSENSQEIEKVQSAQADYIFPPITLLKEDKGGHSDDATEELRQRSQILNDTLVSFGVEAQIINVIRGPAVTRYELILARGVKLTRLTTLQNDIALALGATSVRIAAIPDKSAVGIEVPNKIVQTVFLRDVLTSKAMTDMKSK
ncbi:MAG: hypothetical protein GX633_06450, partial [Clostridiales bacterium]|nr:hypothetical protein [Clostridiales bacterium]